MRPFARQAKPAAQVLKDQRFDVIHAFRVYTASLAISLARSAAALRRPRLHLDLDEIESVTRARLACLYRDNGLEEEAETEAAEAKRFERSERRLLPLFDRVYVASELDARRVQPLLRGEPRVAPNTVVAPLEPVAALTTHPFTFLFVGTMGYYPNEDAVLFFCREVLPKLRAQADRPFLVRIVGSGIPDSLRQLARLPEVRFIGEPSDMAREYADIEAVIVPLRAGGGTRIKVLEAFAYRRPVVSTIVGVEGIEVQPEQHCLIGDTAGDLARQCLRIMEDRALRERLADEAFDLVTGSYSPARLQAAIRPEP
jgi:glycosyltransferase involved in cell wall biosynthesis